MSLKILGGIYKGRTIKSPPSARPTKSLVRKALFDICKHVQGISFLDIFAGSGAMGIEALSRGASKAVFIEKDLLAVKTIRENLTKLKCDKDCLIIQKDALEALKTLNTETFDLIYMDAPYGFFEKYAASIELFLTFADAVLTEKGFLFIEDRGRIDYKQKYAVTHELRFLVSRKYGDTWLHQFIKG